MNGSPHDSVVLSYSVLQFFYNGKRETVRERVTDIEAFTAFRHYCSSVGAQLGTTVRVLMIDSDDYIVAEWLHDRGLVFPTQEMTDEGGNYVPH